MNYNDLWDFAKNQNLYDENRMMKKKLVIIIRKKRKNMTKKN